jgi:hypothetical protein
MFELGITIAMFITYCMGWLNCISQLYAEDAIESVISLYLTMLLGFLYNIIYVFIGALVVILLNIVFFSTLLNSRVDWIESTGNNLMLIGHEFVVVLKICVLHIANATIITILLTFFFDLIMLIYRAICKKMGIVPMELFGSRSSFLSLMLLFNFILTTTFFASV